MKRFAPFLMFIALCFLQSTATIAEERATLVFAADMPVIGDLNAGAYPQLSALLSDVRKESENTFFAFGGGSLGPSPMSAFDRGSHIIDILNSLEPDVMGVTKREFSYFEDELSLRSYEAAFPIVASNILDPLSRGNLNGLMESSIVEKGEFKIGFISIIDESVIREYLLKRIKVLDPELAVKLSTEKLRRQGADSIVLMYSYPFAFIEELLSDKTIDVALLSDPHIEMSELRAKPDHPNSVVLAQPGDIAVLSMEKSLQTGATLLNIEYRDIRKLQPEMTISRQVDGYLRRLNRLLDERIGELKSGIDTTRPVVRGQESGFANFITDAMRESMGADIALLNGGVIRGEKIYSSNTILTRRDIATELPFRSRVVMIEVTGSQILSALESGFAQIEDLKGRYPQVSGLTVEYDSNAAPGQRVISVKVGNQTINSGATYTMATTDYLASGGDGYESLILARRIDSSRVAPLLSDIVINTLRTKNTIAPRIEGRLVDKGSRND